MASSEPISDVFKPCAAGACVYCDTIMDGACPTSAGFPCFNFAEACRLRKKYWSASNEEIVGHIDLVTVRGIGKSPPPPENPEAYLRTISRNLEKELVKEDQKRKAVYEASQDEGPLGEFAAALKESGVGGSPMEARDSAAFLLSQLPAEPECPNTMSTRDFMVEYILWGMKPGELLKKYPQLTMEEIKDHQKVIRETRRELQGILGEF